MGDDEERDAPESTETGTTTAETGETDEWAERMATIRTMVREEMASQFSGLPDLLSAHLKPEPKQPAPEPKPKQAAPKQSDPPAQQPPQKRRFVLQANPRRKPRA